MFGSKKITEMDNRLNAIFGYRQSVNLAALGVACFAYYYGLYEVCLILLVLGLKWYATQVYHNIDAVEVMDSATGKDMMGM